ncbi:hypothetical protein RJ55_05821 [Drechmeria coniospora]|nr:hypothetical protein RJ55_05821 [Drechmeria coniospora]
MVPVRRYLRITKYSVLECRIYLDNPSLAQSWLLNPRYSILPRVIESIRPLVLPKLREEKERSQKKSSKKKSVKDVIVQDDFEVSMFLTETSTRHSLLTRQKHFREKAPPMMSNSSRLIGETDDVPVDIDAEDAPLVLLEEDGDDEHVQLENIPTAEPRPKRKRNAIRTDGDDEVSGSDGAESVIDVDSDPNQSEPKPDRINPSSDADEDDKKKLAMDVSYEGFAIHGRVLCLVVRKRDNKTQQQQQQQQSTDTREGVNAAGRGQARMENWITSTQIPVGDEGS